MIDHDTAKGIVLRFLATVPLIDDSGWGVIDEKTREYDVAWFFQWTVKSSLEPGARRYPMAGNNPLLVDKRDGTLYAWSLLEPLDRVLDKLKNNKGALRPLDVPPPR
jgi:hypothetical protein